ncbi:ubiquitin carboxyl-terminal hydrolase 25 isoform X2 [Nematostella vectensis]|uniref:ubiquitin carboxyl-terminal hydrolase 25 isoform X2 n=1 Tax=Nematostella vectensis TaxID=45351 RepID=UPI0020777D09|nr:ubiquitin carboxyl-terminal hydrolase 25 isoform X2 [Nematostella vectensis]
MTVEYPSSMKKVTQENEAIHQVCEITGVSIEEAQNAFAAGNYNVDEAISILTQSNLKSSTTHHVVKKTPVEQEEVIDLTKDKDDRDDDLEKAIALSLQESQAGQPQGITAEEQDISRVLEASLIENKPGQKRKRGDPWMMFVDPVNPYDRKRVEGTPVGFKNVGNTCWFSAVIQALFHLPVFRKLVLGYQPPSANEQKDAHQLLFMLELRKLFALLVASKRKYVDPIKAIEILKEALQYNGSESNPGNQQDVSEFTHKLLEWLEDTFNTESKEEEKSQADSSSSNPVVELFFGQSKVDGVYEGNRFSNIETFGACPLQVQGYSNLHDSLEGGMAAREIEPANHGDTQNSGQEHWFTRLPLVLTFMLSRFLFNQSIGRAEKIHEKFLFDKCIYMDRYMERNKELSRRRREEVKTLKERHQLLKSSLDRYTNYGSGAKRSPIQDILDSALNFVRSTPPSDSTDVEMHTPIPGSPVTFGATSAGPSTLFDTRTPSLHPAPRYVTESELETIATALRRWRTEVEQDVLDISTSLKEVEEAISVMYNDEEMKTIPYRLYAVLVHEGQANGGHYWAYINDPLDRRWRKFNDITVSEVTWEEVERESLGGYRNVSAYCLLYCDARREEVIRAGNTPEVLSAELQQMVNEDNASFEQELRDWDEKQAKAAKEAKSQALVVARPDLVLDAEASCAVSPRAHSPAAARSESVLTANLGVLPSLVDSSGKKLTIDEAITQWCINEKTRLDKLAREYPPEYPGDVRLEHLGIYLMRCSAPDFTVEWAILESVIDEVKAKDQSLMPYRKRVQEFLETEKGTDRAADYKRWKEMYMTFKLINSCFLTGLEHFHSQKYKESLPYLVHAYELNRKLSDPTNNARSMDQRLLAHCRRVCFLKLNELAISLFESDDYKTLCEGLDLVSEQVVPCIPQLVTSPYAEDREAVEHMRNNWFTYLGGTVDEKRQEKLQDFLPKLLDGSTDGNFEEMRPPPVMRPTNSKDLCERFTRAMEIVHANMPFAAKA